MAAGNVLPQTLPGIPNNSTSLLLIPRRYWRILLSSAFIFTTFLFFKFSSNEWTSSLVPESVKLSQASPPHYYEFYEYERNLPQHDVDLPAPEGRHAKFFWVKNHVRHSGWGNFMQELIWNSHIAYSANRSFVFYNYTWFRGYDKEYRVDGGGRVVPNRYPLSSMISGPTIGGPFPPGVYAPRAISLEHYHKLCPNPLVLQTAQARNEVGQGGSDVMVRKWVEILNGIDNPCVEIDDKSDAMFDIWMFGSPRVLGGWPELSVSPILTQFKWSDLVMSAFETNQRVFLNPGMRLFPVVIPSFPVLASHDQSSPIPGLLALHIRHGDFIHHCGEFIKYGSTFNGFNQFPELVDKFNSSGDGGPQKVYMRSCYPTIEQIMDKIREVLKTPVGSTLDRVYIMTNADNAWLKDLGKELRIEAKWKTISTKRDLDLTPEMTYVAQAFDMMIGQRAQVFIGNGFSSLTSNVVMLRMARKFPPESTRFW